jgi:hypothetical protein
MSNSASGEIGTVAVFFVTEPLPAEAPVFQAGEETGIPMIAASRQASTTSLNGV